MTARRAHVERSTDGARIEIAAEPARWHAPVLAVLIVAEVAGLVRAVAAGGDALFALSCALGLLVSALALAQLVFGREVIGVSERELVLETATWPWRYRRRFDRDKVQRLRVDPDGHQGDIEFRAFAEGTVAFDYNGRAYRFGAKLAEDESRRLVDLLATA